MFFLPTIKRNYYWFYGLVFFIFILLLPVFSLRAGCCECRPPVYGSNGQEIKNCLSGASDRFACMQKCNTTEAELNLGYPKFEEKCDADNCPLPPSDTCCVKVNKLNNRISQCVEGISQGDCVNSRSFTTDLGHWYDRVCSEVNSCQAIGRVYDNSFDLTAAQREAGQAPEVLFRPQVTIPGSIKIGSKTFTVRQGQGIAIDGLLVAKYIKLLFNWLLGAMGVVAVVFLAYGGMQWLLAFGNASEINKAKVTIRDSLFGLLLGSASWLLLYLINPQLVSFQELSVEPVKRCELETGNYLGSPPPECQQLSNKKGNCNVVEVDNSNVRVAGPHVAMYMQSAAAQAFEKWMEDFHNATGIKPQVNSMFRTPEYQSCLHNRLGSQIANKPCSSTHEQGRAVDLNINSLTKAEYNKLKELGNDRGFRPQNPNKGESESWHFTYILDNVKRNIADICPGSICGRNIPPREGCDYIDE